jgi:hypothetical protein
MGVLQRTEMDLFDREDPLSTLPEDAVHWIGVYQSLVDFCDTFQSAENPAPRDAERLARHEAHFRGRLRFWHDRLMELTETAS